MSVSSIYSEQMESSSRNLTACCSITASVTLISIVALTVLGPSLGSSGFHAFSHIARTVLFDHSTYATMFGCALGASLIISVISCRKSDDSKRKELSKLKAKCQGALRLIQHAELELNEIREDRDRASAKACNAKDQAAQSLEKLKAHKQELIEHKKEHLKLQREHAELKNQYLVLVVQHCFCKIDLGRFQEKS